MLNSVFKQRNMMALKSRMLSSAAGNPLGVSARQFSQVFGGQEGSTVSYKSALFHIYYREHLLLVITLLLTTSMTQSSLVLEEQDLELLSVYLKLDSRLLAFPSCSQLDLIQLLLRVELTPLWVTCMRMTGDGIFMIP
jgi:hypothetical protein